MTYLSCIQSTHLPRISLSCQTATYGHNGHEQNIEGLIIFLLLPLEGVRAVLEHGHLFNYLGFGEASELKNFFKVETFFQKFLCGLSFLDLFTLQNAFFFFAPPGRFCWVYENNSSLICNKIVLILELKWL